MKMWKKVLVSLAVVLVLFVLGSVGFLKWSGAWGVFFPSRVHETIAPEIPADLAEPAVLLFTKTNSGGTDNVWFYDLQADGLSLDDKRAPQLDQEKLGPVPSETLDENEHEKNNLPDALARWRQRDTTEHDRARTDQSFCVPKADIAANDYDLSINRYKEVEYEVVEHEAPKLILARLAQLEEEIATGRKELEEMIG